MLRQASIAKTALLSPTMINYYNIMVDLANDNNYTIINVPGSGNCLFNCVARQLLCF